MKITYKMILILITGLVFSGCATSYQKEGFSGGYNETQLSENIFRVTFKGNGYTHEERASDFLLLRSSELTLNNDYKYFAIISDFKDVHVYTTDSTYSTTGKVNSSGYFTAETEESKGITVRKPLRENTILCLKEKPKDRMVFDAKFLYNSIRKKYDIKD